MYIKSFAIRNGSSSDISGYVLANSMIDLHSKNADTIMLPYAGQLPSNLSNADSAAIVFSFRIGLKVNVFLSVNFDGKQCRYPIYADPAEIVQLMQQFFFNPDGTTRKDTGLDQYSLGLYQGSFLNWKRIVVDSNGLDDLLFHLSPDATERILQHIATSKLS